MQRVCGTLILQSPHSAGCFRSGQKDSIPFNLLLKPQKKPQDSFELSGWICGLPEWGCLMLRDPKHLRTPRYTTNDANQCILWAVSWLRVQARTHDGCTRIHMHTHTLFPPASWFYAFTPYLHVLYNWTGLALIKLLWLTNLYSVMHMRKYTHKVK